MKSSKTIWIVVTVILILGGVMLMQSATSNESSKTQTINEAAENSEISVSEDGTIVSYQGVEGENALDIAKNLIEVRVEASTFGEFVTGIGNVEADPAKNFWGFYVDGEMANVGAGEYITKEGEEIEWRITELNQ